MDVTLKHRFENKFLSNSGQRSESMLKTTLLGAVLAASLVFLGSSLSASAQTTRDDEQFGPVVRAYLGYLRNEQEVVDDRASRHEVSAGYAFFQGLTQKARGPDDGHAVGDYDGGVVVNFAKDGIVFQAD